MRNQGEDKPLPVFARDKPGFLSDSLLPPHQLIPVRSKIYQIQSQEQQRQVQSAQEPNYHFGSMDRLLRENQIEPSRLQVGWNMPGW